METYVPTNCIEAAEDKTNFLENELVGVGQWQGFR